jgi:potassium efflux system protein
VTVAFLRQVCIDEGLADAHFRWSAKSRRILRRNLSWLKVVALPLIFVFLTVTWDAEEARADSLGRAAFMAVLVCLALFLRQVISPSRGIARDVIARRQGGWLDRLRVLWYPAALGVPLAVVVAAAAGYQYTARELAARLLWTLWLGAGILIVHELMLRWLFVARRRMAVERARKRREAQQEEAGEGERGAAGEEARQLLGSLVAVAAVIGLWLIWGEILPALGMLSEVSLWPGTSLAHLGRALVILIVTVIAARNIPGLLEMAVLQRLPLEASVRFAITTISRYLISLLGVILAFDAIGIGWDKVQWLAAAVTVGLGFGLQEIFANFVSGLIILVERPMRVGDTVTVGDTTGTVTRIRMRATTITDWNRKELLVPNKEFITSRLVNWSLSDRILRLVVPVGIAYGSDTEQAAQLLLEVAREHPDVLDEPEPSVVFMDFGESSLDFELRAFLPGVEVLPKVRNDLHMAIDAAFREAGIEIAFPQRDIHIRSVQPPLRIVEQKGQ